MTAKTVRKKSRPDRAAWENQTKRQLRRVGDRAERGDTVDGDRDALRVDGRVGLAGDRVERLNVVRGANQVGRGNARTAVFQVVLVSGSGQLAGVVEDRFVLGSLTNLLERRNGHGGQKADDDHDDHDFDEREALVGTIIHGMGAMYYYYFLPSPK